MWSGVIIVGVIRYFTNSGWEIGLSNYPIYAPYLLGALFGAFFGQFATTRLVIERPAPTRFAAFFALTTIATIGLTALFFFISHRAYFAQWHANSWSITWFFQMLFTGLGTAYLFISTGLRPFVPWTVIMLAIASFSFSRGRFPSLR